MPQHAPNAVQTHPTRRSERPASTCCLWSDRNLQSAHPHPQGGRPMKLSLKIAVGLVLALAAVAASLAIAARFADGPLAIIAGGPFTTGEVHEGPPPDWAFVKDIETIEMQSLNPARSRTTWVLHYDGRVFIPCGYMNSFWDASGSSGPLKPSATAASSPASTAGCTSRTWCASSRARFSKPFWPNFRASMSASPYRWRRSPLVPYGYSSSPRGPPIPKPRSFRP